MNEQVKIGDKALNVRTKSCELYAIVQTQFFNQCVNFPFVGLFIEQSRRRS